MAPVRAVDPANIDRSVSPADDFYRFASGKWCQENPIPDEYSRWGCFEELHELSQAQIRAILDGCEAAVRAGGPADVHARLVGVMYATGMDAAAREAAGVQPMADVFEAIDAAESPADVVVLSARLAKDFGIPSAGFWSLSDR